MKLLRALTGLILLLLCSAGSAQAALLAGNDSFGIPSSRLLLVEAAGVLENDTLDGNNAADNNVTVTFLNGASKGTLRCPDNGSTGLCTDGSFEYRPDASFDGTDSFRYRATAPGGETATATVTLSACDGGPTVFTCWSEAPYLAKLSELGYNAFLESFEGTTWGSVRSTFNNITTATSISSNNITWTTNFPVSNGITTGSGAARSGSWGVYDPQHGSASGTATSCDIEFPAATCFPFDGFSGSGSALKAVGGYLYSIAVGANVAVVLDGAAPIGLGKLTGVEHQFLGVIDTAGFSTFSFEEQDGKIGNTFPIFGDDFIVATTNAVPPNLAPVLTPLGNQTVGEGSTLRLVLTASDANDGDLWSFGVNNAPPGAELFDNEDGTATFEWSPNFDQAGSYALVEFSVTDNGFPALSTSEMITITVNDVNRAPVLAAVGNKTLDDGNLLSFLLSASDPDGHNMVFTMAATPGGPGLPAGTSLDDHGNGTATFSWTPSFSQVGAHPLRFSVTDDGLPPTSDFEDIIITVTTPDITSPVITLLGSNPINRELGLGYTDDGATAFDNIDGDISGDIVVTNDLIINEVGAYSFNYNVSDVAGNAATTVTRIVNITPDVSAPALSVPSNITVAATDANGTAASDATIAAFLAGASASDLVDGVLSVTNNAPAVLPLGTTTVTFSASDSAGNTGTAQADITITDQTAPVITLNSGSPVSVEQGRAYTDAGATATDNVDASVAVNSVNPVNTNVVGEYTVTYDAVDAAGNAAIQMTRTVNVTADITLPIVTVPSNITVAATDANGTAASDATISAFLAGASASDLVDGVLSVTNNAPAVLPLGTTTVTFSAVDSAGNTGTAQADITITDQTAPVINRVGVSPASVEQGRTYTDAGATATDNVDASVAVNSVNPVNTNVVGEYTVTYDAVDAAGNAAIQMTRTVNVTADITLPIVTVPSNITVAATDANGTAASDATIGAFLAGASASDLVDGVLSVTNNAPALLPLGTTTVTFSAVDSAGNTGTAQADITITDQTAPVINRVGVSPASVEQGRAYTDAGATATDNVDASVAVNSVNPVNTNVVGEYTVTYDAVDAAGNAASQVTRTVNVTADITLPIVTVPSNITVAATNASGTAASDATIGAFLAGASASDLVDGVLSVTNNAPALLPLGTTTVTFSAVDSAGNTGTAQADITITDQTAPVINRVGVSPASVEQGRTYTDAGATATDNVDASVAVNSVNPVNTNVVGEYTVTYDAVDAAGNAASQVTRTVNVTSDITLPVVTVPSNITVAATNASGTAASDATIAAFLAGASASDLVDGVLSVTNNAPAVLPLGTTTVTFSAVDSAGNTGTAQADITITDQTAPVITLNSGSPVSVEQGKPYADAGATATDNVDASVAVNSVNPVNTNVVGEYTVTYDAVDAAGNAASQVTRTVNVTADITLPIVTVPSNITVAATDANGTAASDATIGAFLAGASASDLVDGVLSVTNNAPALLPLGTTTVTFSASDSAGNTGTAQADITITDQTAPVITLNSGSPVSVEQGKPYADAGATATDNVDASVAVNSVNPVNTNVVGEYTVTYDAVDAAGNAAIQMTRTVNVTADITLPIVTVPSNITVAATDANGTAASDATIGAFLAGASASDLVDGVLSVTNNAPALLPLGTTTVTFSAVDSAGNTGTAQADITITDQTAPVIDRVGVSPASVEQGRTYTDAGATATDNVDVSVAVNSVNPVNTALVGEYIVTYDAMDAAGNAASQVTRTVNVTADISQPVVTVPSNITVAATDANGTAASDATIAAFLAGASASDLVDGVLSVTNNAPTVLSLGTTTVTFSATDSAGNTGTAQTDITITDQTAPTITRSGGSPVSVEQGKPYADAGATATDNVDASVTVNSVNPVNTNVVGEYTVTYDAVDAAGNAASQVTRTVNVTADISQPVVTVPSNITVAATNASGTAASDATIAAFLAGASASDLVDGVLSVTNNAPTVLSLGTTTVTFSATDSAGNTGTAQADITITDQTAPLIVLLGATSITLNVGDLFTDPGSDVSDNVDTGLTATVSGSVDTGLVGLYTLTYDAVDTAGNAAIQMTRSVSVQDSSAPVVTPPANITVAAIDINGTSATNTTIAAFLSAASADDSVEGAVAVTHDAPAVFPLGTTTVTFSATDSASNTGSAQATVTIADQTAPIISLLGASTMTLNAGESFEDPGANISDNVDIGLKVTVSGSVNSGLVGLYTLTYSASDAAGNTAIPVTRNVTVQDGFAPVVTAPADILVAATNAGGTAASVAAIANFLNGASASDAVDGELVVSNDAPAVFPLGVTTVIFSASDSAGNAASAQATVTIEDQSAPVITRIDASPINIELGAPYTDAGATASDNVDASVTVNTVNPVDTAVVGEYTVTYDAMDAAGNAAVQVIRIVNVTADVTPPAMTAPANITVAATNANGTAATNVTISSFLNSATAIDAIDGRLAATNDAPAVFPLGETTVTFSAMDGAGNTGSAQAMVTVTDQNVPQITRLGNDPIDLELGTAYNDAGATASDNVDGSVTVTTVNPVDVNQAGVYTVTYDAIDAAGNVAVQVTRTVNIIADMTAPMLTVPANIVVAATDASGTTATDTTIAAFLNGANANDLVDGVLAVTTDAPAVFPPGATTVTFSAADSAGNSSSAQATVTVADQTAPVITLTGPNSITLNMGDSFADPGATANDNVDGDLSASISVVGSVNTGQIGLYTLTYNVSDAAGNAAIQMSRNVSVQDSGAPVVTASASIIVAATDVNGTAASVPAISDFLNNATATDDVDVSVTVTNDAPLLFPLGESTVTFSAMDSAGNTGSAQSTVTVTDQSAPVISLLGPGSMTLSVGEAFDDPGSAVSDNVDFGLSASVSGSVNTSQVGLYTLTYTANDNAGNAATPVTRIVSVQDSAAPVVTAPGNIIVSATDVNGTAATQAAISGFLSGANATDAVEGTITVSNDAPAVFPLGITTVTFSAMDSAANSGSAQATVTIVDQTAPMINLRGASSMTINVGDSFADPGATASDNVDGDLSTSISVVGSVDSGQIGLYTLTYNVSDAAGNAAVQVSRNVSVQDSGAPVVSAPASIIVAATNADGSAATDAAISSFVDAATATDSVDGALAVSHDAPAVFPLGETTVTFSAMDGAGNTGSAQATVTVTDQNAPVISLLGPGSMTLSLGESFDDPGTAVSDNVDSGLIATVSGSVNSGQIGLYTLTYSASDSAGNSATPVTRKVSVQDSAAPVVTVPGNLVVAATEVNGTVATDTNIAAFLNDANATDSVDGPVAVSNDAPAVFPLGVTVVTFSAMDGAGNTGSAQATVTVVDETAPMITLQGLGTVNVELCDLYVDPGATAADNIDGDISADIVAVSTVDISVEGSYSVTYTTHDAAGNEATPVVRVVNITPDVTAPVIEMLGNSPVNVLLGSSYVDAGASVTDNAEIIDKSRIAVSSNVNINQVGNYSVTYNVSDTPGNAATAVTRIVNVVADVNAPPVVTAPADITTVAQGGTTSVELGTPSVSDDLDGPIVATPDNPGPFVPGHHQILWQATDSSGNSGFAIQFIDVEPLVEFAPNQLAEPGATVRVRILLNGDAASYPVTVNYDVFDDSGVKIGSGSTDIDAGIGGHFDYVIPTNLVTAGITFAMTTVTNGIEGPMQTHEVSLTSANVAPLARLEVTQNGKLSSIIAADAGLVSVRVIVQDTNPADTHRYDWSRSDNVLLTSAPGPLDAQFIFDPSALLAGVNLLDVQVSDSGSPPLTSRVSLYLQVLNAAPLLTSADSDGDGVDDDIEGFGDDDSDGIPNHLDSQDNRALLPIVAGVYDKWLINVQPGLELRLGNIARLAGGESASIDANDMAQVINLLGASVPAYTADDHNNVGGYFDFEIHGLNQPGQTALVVIPQLSPIPAAAVYRKFRMTVGWSDFVVDLKNGLYSAPGEAGVCPAPGAAAFVPGLIEGFHCVQLLIEDGGANDGDGLRNGVIIDPGGVSIVAATPPTTGNGPTAAGGGGSGGGSGDPVICLLLLGLYGLAARRRPRLKINIDSRAND